MIPMMKRIFTKACLLLAISFVYAEEKSLIPMEDFFKNPEKSVFQLSYNGDYIAYLGPWKNRLNIFVQRAPQSPVQLSFEGDRDIQTYHWANNYKLVFLKDTNGDENFHLYTMDVNGRGLKDLTPYPNVKVALIDDLRKETENVLIGMNMRDSKVFDAYRINVNTGNLSMAAQNPGTVIEWKIDHAGKVRVAIAVEGTEQVVLYRDNEMMPFREIARTNHKETFLPIAFTFDNKSLYVASSLGRDKAAIVVVDPFSGAEKKLIYEHPDVDVTNILLSEKRKKLLGVSYVTDKLHYVFFDDKTKDFFEDLASKFPGMETRVISSNKEEDKHIIRTFSDRDGGAYYLYFNVGKKVIQLAEFNPKLSVDELSIMKPIEYKSRDGLTIHGYLTLPKDKAPVNLPVVVFPHGGPWARDYWGYNPVVQFLASRGYGVLQMNYRSSTGYGKAFYQAGFKQWGKAMQNDITDGVHWLIEQGIANPKKLAIYGSSYGGYAALAGATFTPDLYACAISFVGPSNLITLLHSFPPYWEPLQKITFEQIGDPATDAEELKAVSPFFHVDQIKIPLFIAQGANDPRVKQQESDQIVEALHKKGQTVEYMLKKDEGHGFMNEENRFDFYRALEAFLKEHIGE